MEGAAVIQPVQTARPFFVYLLRAIFGRSRSRLTGKLMRLPLPRRLRSLIFSQLLASWNKDKAADFTQPLDAYRSFSEFFSRRMIPEVRPIHPASHAIVSPVDGQLVGYESWDPPFDSVVWGPQVKGARFHLTDFLGLNLTTADKEVVLVQAETAAASMRNATDGDACAHESGSGWADRRSTAATTTVAPAVSESTLAGGAGWPTAAAYSSSQFEGERQLRWHAMVLYLAPHNYHHFHSPVALDVHERRHFGGYTLPVFKLLASKLNNLFTVNERVVLEGNWEHGKFFYVAVAAYNVGNIELTLEPNFRTNLADINRGQHRVARYVDASTGLPGVRVSSGFELGEFKLGSTVVLIFSAPKTFKLRAEVDSEVRMGQLLFSEGVKSSPGIATAIRLAENGAAGDDCLKSRDRAGRSSESEADWPDAAGEERGREVEDCLRRECLDPLVATDRTTPHAVRRTQAAAEQGHSCEL